jgi:perosamine synthetase
MPNTADSYIPVNEPLLDGNEKKYLQECIDTGWISSEGPFIRKFEDAFAKFLGRKHAIALTNGTAALDVAVEVLGIHAGDEVIVPALTIISCITQIVRCGAIPVLVDADPLTWNADVSKFEAAITIRTKAIMIVHLYGLPVDADPILALGRKYGLKIIEDAAEMHGQTYRDRKCGTLGDISTFSFYSNKIITTGEGGMVVTDDDAIAAECRGLRNLCFDPKRRFFHSRLGWNLRMTNMQAALGVAQLERIADFIERKRAMGRRYSDALAHLDHKIQLPLPQTDYAENIYWVFPIVLRDTVPFDAQAMMTSLHEKGIGARSFFWPLHEQPVLREAGYFLGQKFPVAENAARRGLYVPSGLAIRDTQIARVARVIEQILT